MRPNLELQRLVSAVKRAVGWVKPCLGVHIRRGDACEKGHERLCFGAAELVGDIRRVAQQVIKFKKFKKIKIKYPKNASASLRS